MEEALSTIISDLHSFQNLDDTVSKSPISVSSLQDLQTLFEDGEESASLFSEMSQKNLSPSSLLRWISIAMDSLDPPVFISASNLYLSILLSPESPIYTFFTPVAFLSLLQSLRRFFKRRPEDPSPDFVSGAGPRCKIAKKRKGRSRNKDVDHKGDSNGTSDVDIYLLFTILEKLNTLLSIIHLSRFPDSLKSLVETVSEILVLGVEFYENSGRVSKFSDLCFHIMQSILSRDHGDPCKIAIEVLKSISSSILLPKSQVGVLALGFVKHRIVTVAKECEEVKKALVYFPRYLIDKTPEKLEPRSLAVESVMEIVRLMEFEDQIGFVEYVVKMTEGKAHLRLIAVDLISILLASLPDPLRDGEDCWGLRCLTALIRRCSDVSAGIRARALSNLANVVGFLSADGRSSGRLWDVMGFGDGKLNDLLRRRCQDEKAAVRKAALVLIMKSTALISGRVDEIMLKLIGVACSDPLVSIRKAGLSALSEIFRKFCDDRVVTEWLHAVPRLITDNEASVQTECENLFQELVLDRVSRIGCTSPTAKTTIPSCTDSKGCLENELDSVFPEGVLIILKGICDGEVAPCVKKICLSLGKKKQLKAGIAISLQNIIRESESMWLRNSRPIEKWTAPSGAWFLLSEVSSFLPKAVGWKFLQHHWKLLDKAVLGSETQSPVVQEHLDGGANEIGSKSFAWAADRVFLLQTISNVSVELPPVPAAELAQNLFERIEAFNMHSTEVNAHVKALRTLCKRKAVVSEEGESLVLKCVDRLLSKALEILNNYILEVAELDKNTFRTPPPSGNKKGRKKAASMSLPQAITAVFTIGSLVMVCPSVDLKGTIPALHTIITSGISQPRPKELSQLTSLTVSIEQVAPSLYIQSWLTLGKICLADGKLAKRYIPLFAQELEKSDCAALRNNIVVVMADFCVHYTALVDCYIAKISNSLRDPCEVVRRQTFILLSRLLQRDYVKWRGILFLRFLLSLVDDSEKIRQLADFLFGNILKAKAPLLAYNSFVEAIFVLNDCRAHAGHKESQSTKNGRRLFSIRGNDEKSRTQRMHIYVTLLKQMAPEHLLATSAKLCAEILAAALDGLLDLSDVTAQSVMQDTLQILACKEMRIQSNRGPAAADAAEMEDDAADSGGALAAAKGRVVTQTAKKNLIQNAIPIFIELKRLLESKNSPLMGCLMECLRVLLKDYKNEIDDILVSDPQLRKELLYDMQKYETLKAKCTAREAAATVQRPASHLTPHTHGTVGHRGSNVNIRLAQKVVPNDRTASAVQYVAAEATARTVLKELNRNNVTPPLHSMSLPKLKSTAIGVYAGDRPLDVLESLRRRQSFDSDDEN